MPTPTAPAGEAAASNMAAPKATTSAAFVRPRLFTGMKPCLPRKRRPPAPNDPTAWFAAKEGYAGAIDRHAAQ
jgi:hypothetical protein